MKPPKVRHPSPGSAIVFGPATAALVAALSLAAIVAACSEDTPADDAASGSGGSSGSAGAASAGAGGDAGAGGEAGVAGVAGAAGADTVPCVPPTDIVDLASAKALAPTLDQLCLVAPAGDGTVVPLGRTLPYDLISPLFSDYLLKTRTVYVPEGTAATYDAEHVFSFPAGTMITKTFAYAEDLRQPDQDRHLIETRVLLRTATEWLSLPYLWDEAGTVATLSVGGTIKPLSFLRNDGTPLSFNYLVPNKNQCIKCHEDLAKTELIGPKARNLNRDFAYADGTENQLARWTKLGLLQGAPAPAEAPRLAAWDDLAAPVDARARSWLEINCAHCHNDRGAARVSGLILWASQTANDTLGLCKPPVAAGAGSGTSLFDIVPGKPEESILVYRIRSTDPAVMMPELGRAVVHEEGVALVEEWITGLPGACGTAGAAGAAGAAGTAGDAGAAGQAGSAGASP
jgi:uncharacterized repeat protein (TIGR03806 family)